MKINKYNVLTQTFRIKIVRQFLDVYLRAVHSVFDNDVVVDFDTADLSSRYVEISITYDVSDSAKLFYLGTAYMQLKMEMR